MQRLPKGRASRVVGAGALRQNGRSEVCAEHTELPVGQRCRRYRRGGQSPVCERQRQQVQRQGLRDERSVLRRRAGRGWCRRSRQGQVRLRRRRRHQVHWQGLRAQRSGLPERPGRDGHRRSGQGDMRDRPEGSDDGQGLRPQQPELRLGAGHEGRRRQRQSGVCQRQRADRSGRQAQRCPGHEPSGRQARRWYDAMGDDQIRRRQ